MAANGVSGDLASIAKKGYLGGLRDDDNGTMDSPKSSVFGLHDVATPKSSASVPKVLKPFAKLVEDNKVRLDFIWVLAKKVWAWTVGIALTLLILTAFGIFDAVIPTEVISKEFLIEIFNQIVTLGFTLMCIYLHPERCHHAHALWRWSSADQKTLREAYSKNGTKKPLEKFHFLVIVVLLQANCIGQYALMYYNIVYDEKNRPVPTVLMWLAIALGSAVFAGLYKGFSPLARDYGVAPSEAEKDLEAI